MSLYLKYRPQNFTDLIGQNHISTTLLNALKREKVAHAYLFYGPRGTGKTSTARLIASSLTCESPNSDNQACGNCSICNEARDGSLIDIIEIDAASNRGIDEIRDLKEKIHFSPVRAKKKVYIIDEVHMLTKEAFNALLKTLEEPPAHAHFILATTEIHKVPETIISRCQRFDFRRIQDENIVDRLKKITAAEKIQYDEGALFVIAKIAQGGLRDAIGILEQLSGEEKMTVSHVEKSLGLSNDLSLERLYNSIENHDLQSALEIINQAHETGADLFEFCTQYIHFLREKLHECIKKNEKNSQIIEQLEEFQTASEKLKNAIIAQLPLEIAIIKICQNHISITENTAASKEIVKLTSGKPTKKIIPSSTKSLKPNQSDQIQPMPIELDELQKRWHSVISHINNPALKLSLKECYPASLKEKQLTLHVSSSFHLERVKNTESIKKIEEAISQACTTELTVEVALAELKFSPNAEDRASRSITSHFSQPEANKTEENFDDLAARAADIFGGTLL